MTMHFRVVDEYGVVHYADKIWYGEIAGHVFAPWCVMGQEKRTPPIDKCLLEGKRRSSTVTCLFCWHLRLGARSG